MISILAAVVALGLAVFLFMIIKGRSGGASGIKRTKGREAMVKDANKRLAQNPRDPEALNVLGDIYFQDGEWERAFKTYEVLSELTGTVDEFEVNLRYALSASKLNLTDAAYKGFAAARAIRQDNFEVNYNLGHLEFQKKNYEKAIQLLQQARQQDPDSAAVLRDLGHAFFRVKKPREAMTFIRKAIDLAPDDKESLYTLAECYYEANQSDQALRLFNHLRADPVMGPNACLVTGTINMELHQEDAAIGDFEIGLKHENIKPDILTELRYRLAQAYLKKNNISGALGLLRLIQTDNQSYKDVNILIGKYQELNANKNLQIYLMAPSADFIALCRKIVMSYFARAKVKITSITVDKGGWADILAEVDTSKWSNVTMFRFIRSQGAVGELILRDFHSHLKEVKADKGICVTIGNYTEEAKRYTEARVIDLIEKEKLTAMLNTVDARAAASATVQQRKR
ncbi:MAG: tetratricopeptide repeat protein [Treponema sp.]|nr:tetratricopeptide repeat protein [Treponema sp.]